MKTATRNVPTPARPTPRRRSRLPLLAGLGLAAFLVFFPARQLVSQHMRIDRLEARLEALGEENADLEAEVERLKDPEELELEARERLGMVRPGERAYVFVPQPTPQPTPEPAPEAAPWWSRLWDGLVRLVKGDG